MPEEKDEPSGFKVVDRRTFSADGTRREGSTEEEERSPRTPPLSSRPSAAPIEPEPEEFLNENVADFETLVSYLSTTTMFQLGLLKGPSGEPIPADLANARRTIDLLEVLQEKTQGNLTQDEVGILENVLFELRMSYVEVEKRQKNKQR